MITDFDMKQIASKHRIPLNDVFMKDDPPRRITAGGYIINLDDEETGRNGTHWVALFIPKNINKPIMYADSFGFIIPQSLINWIKKYGGAYKDNQIICNDKQIQDIDSGGCGVYCLFFIQCANNWDNYFKPIRLMNEYNKLWSDNTKDNLQLLKRYVPYYMES